MKDLVKNGRAWLVAIMAALALALALPLAGCGSDDASSTGGSNSAASSSADTQATADRADADIDWQYMKADELVEKLEAGDPVIVLDTRQDDMYNEGHIIGAYHVPVFPLDTTELEDTLREAVPNLEQGDDPIVVVCKSGNKGAKRAVSLLQEEGIDASRLFILEGGGDGWDVEEWTTTENDSTVPGAAADDGVAASGSADADK